MAGWWHGDAPEPGKPGRVKVGPWPDTLHWSDGYAHTMGCGVMRRGARPKWEQIALAYRDFWIVVYDGVPVREATAEFWKIDGIREAAATDTF